MSVTFASPTTATEIQLLLISFALSSIVGVERQFQQKSAGVRTHVLVAMGATTFTLVSAFGFAGVATSSVGYDPSRIAAQIVSGVGFLGAGVIFTRRNAVRGLTTAATIWVSAAIGMACGAGMPTLAAAVTALHLIVMVVLSPLTARLPTSDRNRVLVVRYLDGQGVLRAILAASSEMGFAASILSTKGLGVDGRPAVDVRTRFRGHRPLSDLVITISDVEGVLSVRACAAAGTDDDEDDDGV